MAINCRYHWLKGSDPSNLKGARHIRIPSFLDKWSALIWPIIIENSIIYSITIHYNPLHGSNQLFVLNLPLDVRYIIHEINIPHKKCILIKAKVKMTSCYKINFSCHNSLIVSDECTAVSSTTFSLLGEFNSKWTE